MAVTKRKCSKCGVEQMTWKEVTKCGLCGGPLTPLQDERKKTVHPR